MDLHTVQRHCGLTRRSNSLDLSLGVLVPMVIYTLLKQHSCKKVQSFILCPSWFQASQIQHRLHRYVIKVELLQISEALWSLTLFPLPVPSLIYCTVHPCAFPLWKVTDATFSVPQEKTQDLNSDITCCKPLVGCRQLPLSGIRGELHLAAKTHLAIFKQTLNAAIEDHKGRSSQNQDFQQWLHWVFIKYEGFVLISFPCCVVRCCYGNLIHGGCNYGTI